jgi:hypothetical protein
MRLCEPHALQKPAAFSMTPLKRGNFLNDDDGIVDQKLQGVGEPSVRDSIEGSARLSIIDNRYPHCYPRRPLHHSAGASL